MSEERELDVIIFGATGFTGKYTIYEGIKVLDGLTWGVAGRNKVMTIIEFDLPPGI